jgi:hypothetical protein
MLAKEKEAITPTTLTIRRNEYEKDSSWFNGGS